jgi:ornithine cyclodeaminase/alanine dehydrogenase-like protein (mu-crystallin family)
VSGDRDIETDTLLYLSRADVIRAATTIDPVAVVRDALLQHAHGRTALPAEAYLAWHTADGSFARSLALPGAIWDAEPALGVKLINSSLANPGHGRTRARGLLVQFARETAYPIAILEGAYLSALRTSAYTALSAQLLGPTDPDKIAVIGCGALGEAHVRMLASACPEAHFALYDSIPGRHAAMSAALVAEGLNCVAAGGAREAVEGAGIVVTVTTTTTGYLPHAWLAPGTLVAHVSLDDVLPDVVRLADLIVVDDWDLVSTDERRLLGRLYHAGELIGPHGESSGMAAAPAATRVSTSLPEVLAGRHPGRCRPDEIVLSNPFGMGILDVAMGAAALRSAHRLGVGVELPV